jgi:hypothetical protein
MVTAGRVREGQLTFAADRLRAAAFAGDFEGRRCRGHSGAVIGARHNAVRSTLKVIPANDAFARIVAPKFLPIALTLPPTPAARVPPRQRVKFNNLLCAIIGARCAPR